MLSIIHSHLMISLLRVSVRCTCGGKALPFVWAFGSQFYSVVNSKRVKIYCQLLPTLTHALLCKAGMSCYFFTVFVVGIMSCNSTVANCICASSLICSRAVLTTIYFSINFPRVEEKLDRVSNDSHLS